MIFDKCTVCGEYAFMKLVENDIFTCANELVFKKATEAKAEDDEVWEHMPEWARLLKKGCST